MALHKFRESYTIAVKILVSNSIETVFAKNIAR